MTHDVTFSFLCAANNSWSWTATCEGSTVGTGILNFSPQGALQTATGTLSLTLTNGAASPLAIAPDFSASTQTATETSLSLSGQDGYTGATLTNYSIGSGGAITGIYSNGKNQTLGQIAIGMFQNAQGLSSNGNNLLTTSADSGIATYAAPGSNGSGTIVSGSLEMSNVDIATEFTNMIVAQRAFQANSKVITTSDQLLQDLVNMKQ
jgi:flagellar hook protein FlgE